MKNDLPRTADALAVPKIRVAKAADLRFVVALQRRFTNELGFLPAVALAEWIARGHVHLVEENGDPAGYVVSRPRVNSARWCRPLTQVAVSMDAQRRHLGLALVDHVAERARTELLEAMQCWVAADIEAVDFFQAANFSTVAIRRPLNARQRPLILMRRSLQQFEPADFHKPPAVAGCRPTRIAGTPAEPLIVLAGRTPRTLLLA